MNYFRFKYFNFDRSIILLVAFCYLIFICDCNLIDENIYLNVTEKIVDDFSENNFTEIYYDSNTEQTSFKPSTDELTSITSRVDINEPEINYTSTEPDNYKIESKESNGKSNFTQFNANASNVVSTANLTTVATVDNNLPAESRIINSNEGEQRKSNSNPSVDDIISGIIQLIGGNIKLGRPKPPSSKDQNNQYMKINPTRINNRGPPKIPLPSNHQLPQENLGNILPPSVLIGPGMPLGLPLPHPISPPSKTIPLKYAPTKPYLNIAESDVSLLLDLVKHKPKDVHGNNIIHNKSTINENLNGGNNTRKTIVEDEHNLSAQLKPVIEPNNKTYQLSTSFNTFSEATTSTLTPSLSSSTKETTDIVLNTVTNNDRSNNLDQVKDNATNWLPFYEETISATGTKQWLGEEPVIITKPEEPSVFDITVKHKIGTGAIKLPSPNPSSTSSSTLASKISASESEIKKLKPSRSKPSSSSSSSKSSSTLRTMDADIIYGKPIGNVKNSLRPSFTSSHKPTQVVEITSTINESELSTSSATNKTTPPLGRPTVIPVEVDEVRPQIGPSVLTDAGSGSVYIDGKPKHFKIKPTINPQPTLQVGSGITIHADNQQTNRASPSTAKHQTRPTVIRRPGFRPRPNTPLVRIDTCIVGDDSTCNVNFNEKCKTELGVSTCQCKPGFGRQGGRVKCTPVTSLGVAMRIDKIGEHKVTFNRKYLDPDSEEYQYLEHEVMQALSSMFGISKFSKVYLGTRVNKFHTMGGKMVVNVTIELEMNNSTRNTAVKRVVQQELTKLISANNNNIGDSKLFIEGSFTAIPRVDDVNECANSELNDCPPKISNCVNEFGTFRCTCKPGFEDKYPKDEGKAGRFCSSCTPQYCSNHGDCVIVNGERECRCRGHFLGSKCDIDGEVMAVALGGSIAALIIIIITFLCLYTWNQRWKREQQKMEAMSSGSGQTFSYVNKQAVGTGLCRYAMDERLRWAQMSDTLANQSYNYYVNPEQIAVPSQHHVYATPGRVHTPDALLNDDVCHYARPKRSKSRQSTMMPYQSLNYGPGSVYNETEFSTRETMYTPTHLIISPRSKYSVYN